jgi:hypothetical protein
MSSERNIQNVYITMCSSVKYTSSISVSMARINDDMTGLSN